MTQRIFDVDNPQDVKDLFDILPDDIKKVSWLPDDTAGLVDNHGLMSSTELFAIEWRDKKEITRPVDESKWIGCLCWFWDEDKEYVSILYAINKGDAYPYVCKNRVFSSFKNCRPVRRDEIKFVEDVE